MDTSALVKRYIDEHGSEIVDNIYKDAYQGIKRLSFSYLNIAEAIVVFDKYAKRLGVDAKEIVRYMLRESITLSRLNRLITVSVNPSVLLASIELVLKYHIYVADALQIASAKRFNNPIMVTGDKKIANIAEIEGLKVLYLEPRS
jgi:predicted nucleic acid-binding protein